jgi:Asp-tRNA(Asn)/Glu-tRNA(Gln) amidotransferase C subunit
MATSELQLHKDLPGESFTQEEALSASGLSENSNFKVPKIL